MPRARLLLILVAAGLLLAAPFAHGATSSVVISQVYAGGGNAGASYTNDFVELLNRGSTAVDLSGWTVQYAPASSTSWQTTSLSGSLGAGRYYLVQLGSTAQVGSPLPTPDATGTTNLAGSGGKVALVHDATALTCGATPGSCTGAADDLVGYGSATDYEGAGAAPALGATTAAVRAGGGCTDSNVNSSDFTAVAPAPRNTGSPVASCSGGSTTPTATAGASVDVDVQPALSISLERSSLSFGSILSGTIPSPISERVTVFSNNASGYALTLHRTAFAPADLPLGIAAPAGGAQLAIPIAPAADRLIASSAAPSLPAGDVWPASIGFVSALPVVTPGHYTATLTFTVIGT